MTATIASAVAMLLLGAVACWLFGGVALRLGGLATTAAGIGLLLSGSLQGLAVLAIGLAIWLGGHRHFAARHGYFKSALAERLIAGRIGPGAGCGR